MNGRSRAVMRGIRALLLASLLGSHLACSGDHQESAAAEQVSVDYDAMVNDMVLRLSNDTYFRFGAASNAREVTLTTPDLVRYLVGEIDGPELAARLQTAQVETPVQISCAESANLMYYAQLYFWHGAAYMPTSYAALSGAAKDLREIAGPIDLYGTSGGLTRYLQGLRVGDRISWVREHPIPQDVANNGENGVYLGEGHAFIFGLGRVDLKRLSYNGYRPAEGGRVWRVCPTVASIKMGCE